VSSQRPELRPPVQSFLRWGQTVHLVRRPLFGLFGDAAEDNRAVTSEGLITAVSSLAGSRPCAIGIDGQ
jgi:hypothetical protein